MRTRTVHAVRPVVRACARCASTAAATASRARANAKKNASPCVSISTPPSSAKVSRMSRRWSESTPPYPSPSRLSSAVEPSMSLKTKVTVPLGREASAQYASAGKLGA